MPRQLSHLGQQLRSSAGRYRLPRAWLATASFAPDWGAESNAERGAQASRCFDFHGPHRSTAGAEAVSAGSLAHGEELARLEAILFLAREPLNSRKLSQLAHLADGTQARTLVRRLNELYDGAGRAFRIEHVAGGYQLLTRRKFAGWLRRLAHVPGETRLSAPALETLAVIAYRQPVPRADLEAIRGVNCGEILRQLIERDLVRIGGRSDELGRPYLYSTTKRFLQVFGLVTLEDLPRIDSLRHAPLPNAPPPVAALAERESRQADLDHPDAWGETEQQADEPGSEINEPEFIAAESSEWNLRMQESFLAEGGAAKSGAPESDAAELEE